MYNWKVTVFTPTYNRAYKLEKLFRSLEKQSYKNFEWLIVDDGSTDNTEKLVSEFKKNTEIKIEYFKQSNSGKHIAINNAVQKAKGELFFIVDSDDYLTEFALEIISNTWDSIENKNEFIGIGARKKVYNKASEKFVFNEKYFDDNAINFNLVNGNMQDKAEVFQTEKLKKYKFKQFENEKFMTEAVVWYKMAEDGYKIRWVNEEIYICEYLGDGLSNNFYKQRIQSLNSTCYSYNLLSSYNLPIKYKVRYKINYFRYGIHMFDKKYLFNNLYDKKNKRIFYFLGKILNFFDKKRYK